MSRETVRVQLRPRSLILRVPEESLLLGGTHRIYFVNVLGFEPSTAPSGYVISDRVPDPSLLLDIVDYLRDLHIEPVLNRTAHDAIQALQALTGDLASARAEGLEIKSAPLRTVNVPGLKRTLKPYQHPAIAHAVAVRNAANFSVPGSGKTTIALSSFALFRTRQEVEKLVIVGPRASFAPWEEEFEACFLRHPLSVRITGTQPRRMKLYRQAETAEMLLMTYQTAHNDKNRLKRFLLDFKCLLVLDESHHIKRFEGGTWAPTLIDVGSCASRRMILTGTPAPHSVTDLWSQMTFLWPRPPVLGTMEEFKFRVNEKDGSSLEQLRQELSPLYWRIRKRDLGLPEPRVRRIRLKLRPYQKAIYTVLSAKVLSDIVKAPSVRTRLRAWRTAKMVRLLQASSNPALLTQHSVEFQVPPLSAAGLSVDDLILHYHQYETPIKLEFAAGLARSLIQRHEKVVIWTAFIHNIRTLERSLNEFRPRVVYGDIPRDPSEDVEFNREQMIQDFRLRDFPLLIANPSACAESVSLHKVCDQAIYVDRTFNAAHYMQSLDRIHRVGMDPNQRVQYYLLISQDTIDEVIDKRLTEKENRMRRLLDDDITVLNLDYETTDFSEDTEEDQDFSALVEHLERTVQPPGSR